MPTTQTIPNSQSRFPFKAIAAMAENRVIGAEGDIPWHLPEDLKWFKQCTLDAIVVMGRKTYESIGRPLPRRETFVLSRTPHAIPGVRSFTDLSMLEKFKTDKPIWIAGGAEIYALMLPFCHELMLTRVHQSVDGDTFFPPFEDRFSLAEVLHSSESHNIERWVQSADS